MSAQLNQSQVVQTSVIQNIFGPNYLNTPGILEHLPSVVLSAVFYQLVYSFVGPQLFLLFGPGNLKGRSTKLAEYYFCINLVSICQSAINSALAINLLLHTGSGSGLTAQERYLGYDAESAKALAVATGYFCFHMVETWVNRRVWGYSMFLHGVCALLAVSLGFRPMALHYSAIFLIWEVPNLFLNIQRNLDRYGKRLSWIRRMNRLCILSTYATLRLGIGTYSILWMGHDMVITLMDSNLKLGVAHIVPQLRVIGQGGFQTVQGVPAYLALFQLGSMVFLSAQGYWWFWKIFAKGDI
ncbi:TLC domain containing protein [Hyaloscypha variabilis]